MQILLNVTFFQNQKSNYARKNFRGKFEFRSLLSYYNCTCKLDNGLSSSTLGDLLVIVGDVVDVKEAVSIVVNEENVLNRLLLLLENVMEPSEKNNNTYMTLIFMC